jgi:hypothetical protein
MLVKRSTLSVYNIHVEVHIALGVAMSATDPPPTIALESSSWLQASEVWVAAMAAGYKGKGKTFGTPTLSSFGSVKGLTWCMDRGMDRPPPPPPSTTLEGFGSVKGKSKGFGSVMDQGKGQGFGQPTLESLDSHDDYGKGKGKGKGQSELDESFRVWPEAAGKCKGKGCGKPILTELFALMETCNPGVMGGSGAGEFTSGSGE